MGLTFDDLPDVAIARGLLRRWWGLELGLSEAAGAGYVRTSHAVCETVQGAVPTACTAALADIAAAFTKAKHSEPVIQACHAGMFIVAAPVYGAGGLLGVVYASGARAADRSIDTATVAPGFLPSAFAAAAAAVATR
ncbi:MAG: PocR ligand-binding domain-containing protein, partial [Myxococcales bacterium]|nr:PocR ligand-binding domain-containing protein [Myxococcales bacterium]